MRNENFFLIPSHNVVFRSRSSAFLRLRLPATFPTHRDSSTHGIFTPSTSRGKFPHFQPSFSPFQQFFHFIFITHVGRATGVEKMIKMFIKFCFCLHSFSPFPPSSTKDFRHLPAPPPSTCKVLILISIFMTSNWINLLQMKTQVELSVLFLAYFFCVTMKFHDRDEDAKNAKSFRLEGKVEKGAERSEKMLELFAICDWGWKSFLQQQDDDDEKYRFTLQFISIQLKYYFVGIFYNISTRQERKIHNIKFQFQSFSTEFITFLFKF